MRDDIRGLERSELERVAHLRGHQTVDDLEALQQSFVKLDHAVLDIEQTLAPGRGHRGNRKTLSGGAVLP
ncbi:hypothetical protein [Pseudomonas viridiflava]|uniref:hypothetical protein n=1 Tax=Pseudomonas viridiflava TaxID=33069 RepID=UPI001F13C452|nr:hypothetical protein [Pseudomonas viridiflava]